MAVLSAYFYEIVFLASGLLCGVVLTALVYIIPSYRKFNALQNDNAQLRESCVVYQKQLSVFQNKNKELEKQLRSGKQLSLAAAPDHEEISSQAQQNHVDWHVERQQWQQQHAQMKDEFNQLQQEKEVLEGSLSQAHERWKLEREELQQANQALSQQLKSHSTDLPQSGLATVLGNSLVDSSKAKADEWQAKLQQQQAAWQRDRKLLQGQLARVKADKKALETELVSQASQSEREKQALEQEIELLTARMLRFQNELERSQPPQYSEPEFESELTPDPMESSDTQSLADNVSEPAADEPQQQALTNGHSDEHAGNGAPTTDLANTAAKHLIADETQAEQSADNPAKTANNNLNP